MIENFRSDFKLRRGDEPGLSVVIPFLSEVEEVSIRAEDVVRAVIKHYFYPIISDNLVVEVSDCDRNWRLGSDNVKEVVSQLDWPPARELNREDIIQLLEMVRTGLRKPEADWIELGYSPKRDVGEILSGKKETLAKRFDSGELLHFKIPVWVEKKGGRNGTRSYFRAVIQKDETVEQGKDYYVRGNLAIQDIDTVKSYNVRAFVHIKEDEPLAHLLRDTEEPSHSNWRTGSTRAKEKYINADQTVRFVKNAVRDILAAFAKEKKEEVRKDEFIVFFSVRKPKTDSGGKDEPRPGPPEPPEPQPALFKIDRVGGGFTVSTSGGRDLPESINIELAYEWRGNPLSRYSPYDFRLEESPIAIKSENCSCEGSGNRLVVTDICEDFRTVVTGFDANRDLYIKAESVEARENKDD